MRKPLVMKAQMLTELFLVVQLYLALAFKKDNRSVFSAGIQSAPPMKYCCILVKLMD